MAVAALLALALAIRLMLFIGYQGHDDRTYIAYAWLFAHGGDITARGLVDPWVGRIGAWLPIAASIRLFGGSEAALTAYSLATSLAGLLALLVFGRDAFGARAALLAGLLYALLPIDVLYATRAFGDQALGVWCVVALMCFWRALASNHAGWSLAAGLAFGLAYLTKETAVLMAVPFALIAWQQRHTATPRAALFAIAGVVAVVVLELVFWQLATGDALYRWHATLSVRGDFVPPPPAIRSWFDHIPRSLPAEIARSENTLADAALMLTTNEEWGLLYVVVLPLALAALWRGTPVARALATFVLSMLLLLLFFPLHFPNYTLARDPRFYTSLSIPALLLLADWMTTRLAPLWRRSLVALFAVSWAMCLYVGHVSSTIGTQRDLAAFIQAHPGERYWMNSIVACDVIVLGGFDPRLDLGIVAVRGGRVAAAPDVKPSNALRALRDGVPVASDFTRLAGQPVVLAAGVQTPPGWALLRQFDPRPDRLASAARGALAPYLPPALVDKIAPSQGQVLRLYRAGAA